MPRGLSETFTYCFAEDGDLERANISETGRGVPVRIKNPLLANNSEMRRSILPGLLRSVAYNLDHGVPNVALYEQGRVFFGHEKRTLPDEPRYVAGVLCGAWGLDGSSQRHQPLDFFDAKGVVERLLAALRITKVRFKVADASEYPWLQPGRAAEVYAGGELLGWSATCTPRALRTLASTRTSWPSSSPRRTCCALPPRASLPGRAHASGHHARPRHRR